MPCIFIIVVFTGHALYFPYSKTFVSFVVKIRVNPLNPVKSASKISVFSLFLCVKQINGTSVALQGGIGMNSWVATKRKRRGNEEETYHKYRKDKYLTTILCYISP